MDQRLKIVCSACAFLFIIYILYSFFKGNKNDLVIICTYTDIPKNEVKKHSPKLVYFKNNSNDIDKIKSSIPIQKNNNVVSI